MEQPMFKQLKITFLIPANLSDIFIKDAITAKGHEVMEATDGEGEKVLIVVEAKPAKIIKQP